MFNLKRDPYTVAEQWLPERHQKTEAPLQLIMFQSCSFSGRVAQCHQSLLFHFKLLKWNSTFGQGRLELLPMSELQKHFKMRGLENCREQLIEW